MSTGGNDGCLTSPGWTRGNPTTAFQYVLNLKSMIQISQALNNTKRTLLYQQLLNKAIPSYHEVFFNSTLNHYGTQQTANVLPIYIGAVPDEHLKGVVSALVDSIMNFPSTGQGPHISTGIITLPTSL